MAALIVATRSAFEFYSTTALPGANGADNTTIYNWAVVKMNYTVRAGGAAGI